jgi:tetratricopeptide (TPR) repeat protein
MNPTSLSLDKYDIPNLQKCLPDNFKANPTISSLMTNLEKVDRRSQRLEAEFNANPTVESGGKWVKSIVKISSCLAEVQLEIDKNGALKNAESLFEKTANYYRIMQNLDISYLTAHRFPEAPERQELFDIFISQGDVNLNVKNRLEVSEKAYAAALALACKTKNRVHESISIQKLAEVYSVKGTPEALVKAAGLYNYALHITEEEKRVSIKTKLLDIEQKLISHSKGISRDSMELAKQGDDNRHQLREIRISFGERIASLPEDPSPEVVQGIHKEIAASIRSFVETLANQVFDSLGPPPCEYAILHFGSGAREEITLHSDLEFGIFIKEDTAENRQYFKNFTSLLHLKVVNLGETILPALNISGLRGIAFFDAITPRGFAFDGEGAEGKGCKTPFGNRKTFELIQTPQKMAQYIGKNDNGEWWYEKEPQLPMELLTFSHLMGSSDLSEAYRQAVDEVLEMPCQADLSLRDYLSKQHLADPDFLSFSCMKDLGNQKKEGMLFKVKQDLYRFPQLAIDRLALFHGIQDSNTFERIEKLHQKGALNRDTANSLTQWISIVMQMRLKTYIDQGAQREDMNPLLKAFRFDDDSESTRTEFALDPASLEKIKYIYQIFVPLHICMLEFHQPDGRDFLQHIPIDSTREFSAVLSGEIAMRLLQYAEAKEHFLRAIEEQPENAHVLNMLGDVCKKLEDLDSATRYMEKALDIEIRKGEDESTIAQCHNDLGIVYLERGQLELALKHLKQALEIDLRVFGENSASVGRDYGNLSTVYHDLQQLDEAKRYILRALDIRLKLSGYMSPTVAIGYNNLAMIEKDQGQLNAALTHIQKSVDINLQLYGATNPVVAKAFINMSRILLGQRNFESALESAKKAFRIDRAIFPERSTSLARDYSVLGDIYSEQGDYVSAEENLAKSDEIYRDLNKNGALASNYMTRAAIARNQGNFALILEHVSQALNIYEKKSDLLQMASCYRCRAYAHRHQQFPEIKHAVSPRALRGTEEDSLRTSWATSVTRPPA